MMRTTLIHGFSALAVLGLGGGIAGCGKDDAAAGGNGERPPTLVRVQQVTVDDVSPKVIVVGTVTAKRKSIVASGANGVVANYDVDEGQWVSADDVLSVLRMESSNREIAEAKAMRDEREQIWVESKSYREEEIKESEFKKQAAQKKRDIAYEHMQRMQTAYESNAINRDQLDEAHERYEVAEAELSAAKQVYARLHRGPRDEKRKQAKYRYEAQKEQVGFLEAEQAKRTTKAPFDGYVVREHTFVGQWLSKGDPVVTLAMLDEVEVVVNVDQKDLRHVQLGGTADVSIPGYDVTEIVTQSNEVFEGIVRSESIDAIHLEAADGKIHKISKGRVTQRATRPWKGKILQIVPRSEWETGSRGFPVKVRIKNRYRMQPVEGEEKPRKVPVLKEGMIATVTFHGEKLPTLLAPKDALVRTTQGMRVNLFRPSDDNPDMGSTAQVTVITGVSVGERIEVRVQPSGHGEPVELRNGMWVVTEGGERLLPVQGNVAAKRGDASEGQQQ